MEGVKLFRRRSKGRQNYCGSGNWTEAFQDPGRNTNTTTSESKNKNYYIVDELELHQSSQEEEHQEKLVMEDLKATCEGVVAHLLGDNPAFRWNEDFFPFTHPSLELEIARHNASPAMAGTTPAQKKGSPATKEQHPPLQPAAKQEKDAPSWLEILGCGLLKGQVLRAQGIDDDKYCGWAFGFGLERIAMLLFQIPDIRLFWSEDERFLSQFEGLSADLEAGGERWRKVVFRPFSKYPSVTKDLSFWLPNPNAKEEPFNESAFFEIVRDAESTLLSCSSPASASTSSTCSTDSNRTTTTSADTLQTTTSSSVGDYNARRSPSCSEYRRHQETASLPTFMPPNYRAGGEQEHYRLRHLVESVKLISEYWDTKSQRLSRAYRIVYRDMSRTLTHEEVNSIQNHIVQRVTEVLQVKIR
ncbi:unnamed protein product [Amoebophrya sp. A25]|nr:unnamed protein product [Amoebophrya sp. A25]|eukprot:GSA25T00000647001.1